jgi:hypothetical protein
VKNLASVRGAAPFRSDDDDEADGIISTHDCGAGRKGHDEGMTTIQ